MRSLHSYLLVPRPRELATKSLFVAVPYLVARSASTAPGPSVVTVAAALIVFEGLAYQARYMVNDLLDADLDAHHPAADSRGRLPRGTEPTIRHLSMAIAGGRVVLALALCWLLPDPARRVAVGACALIALLTASYEVVRTDLRRPVEAAILGQKDIATTTLLVLVGSGYALRAGLGFALAGTPAATTVLACIYSWSLGVAYVTMSWTLEATTFVLPGSLGLDTRLARKRHLAFLLRKGRVVGTAPQPSTSPPTYRRVLAAPVPADTPWGIGLLVMCVAAGPLSAALSSGSGLGGFEPLAVLALVLPSVIGGLLALRTSATANPVRLAVWGLSATLTSVIVATHQAAVRPLLAGVPIALGVLPISILRRMSYEDVAGMTRRQGSAHRNPSP